MAKKSRSKVSKKSKTKSKSKKPAAKKAATKTAKTKTLTVAQELQALNAKYHKIAELLLAVGKSVRFLLDKHGIAPPLIETKNEQSTGNQADLFDPPAPDMSDGNGGTDAHVTITQDEITTALQEVAAKFGLPKVKELLGKYNAENVSALKQSDYVQFYTDCNAAK